MKRNDVKCAAATLGAGALAALVYAAGVEPYQLEVNHIEIFAPRLPRSFEGYTIYQISDLHMRQLGKRERLIRALLDALPPADLIALTGDMIHTNHGAKPFFSLARSFKSRDGAFAIFGNSEHKNGVRPHLFTQQLAENRIIPLHNTHRTLERDGETIALAGVDDPVNFRDDLAKALIGVPDDRFTLCLMHSPDSIGAAVHRGVDLVLSGHTHGGQIRLPLYGPLYTHSLLGRAMNSGYYARWKLQKIVGVMPGRTQLYVTRGLGVSGLALRFLCPPEFTIITLRHGLPACRSVSNK